MRVHVRAFPRGKEFGLSPRCYYPASSDLCNPPSGELGEQEHVQSRHPNPAFFPADRSRQPAPEAAAAARPRCLPGPQRVSNLGCQAHTGTSAACPPGRPPSRRLPPARLGVGGAAPAQDFSPGWEGAWAPSRWLAGCSSDTFCPQIEGKWAHRLCRAHGHLRHFGSTVVLMSLQMPGWPGMAGEVGVPGRGEAQEPCPHPRVRGALGLPRDQPAPTPPRPGAQPGLCSRGTASISVPSFPGSLYLPGARR